MKQKGGLLIAAILMIVVFGFVAFTIADIDVHSTRTVANVKDHQDSFDIAEAGLHRAIYALRTSKSSDQLTCENITGNAAMDNVAFGVGRFTATAMLYTPVDTTLSAALSSFTGIIPVASVSGYAASGQILIGSEQLNYTRLGTGSAACGSGFSACFLGATRGQSGTTAASHSLGDAVAQNMCAIESTGVVPDFSNVLGRSVMTVDITLGGAPVRNWIVGKGATIVGGNDSTFEKYGPYDSTLAGNISGVSIISSKDAWAVGNDDGKTININYWNGSAWTLATKENGMIYVGTTIPRRDLYDITCVNSQNCWAVGQGKTFMRYMLKDGALSWVNNASYLDSTVPSEAYYGVNCYDNGTSPAYTETGPTPYSCWAVGSPYNVNQSPTFVFWDGTANTPKWTLSTAYDNCVPNSKRLRSVACVSADDCWAVGDRESGSIASGCPSTKTNIDHWNGTVWTRVAPDQSYNKSLFDVVCVSANECYAVGDRLNGHGLVLKYNGTDWREMDTSSLPNQNLFTVACSGSEDCITAGDDGAIGKLTGSTWTNISSPTDSRLLGVAMLPNSVSSLPSVSSIINWQEE